MIPYGSQSIDRNDVQAVTTTLKSKWLTQGPKVQEFENGLANYCGVKYAVAASSGTAALHLAYLAAGLKKGDEVITTPNTFVATTNMLLVLGAKPVFGDIRLDTYNLDESKIAKLITKKTKAIVPVDFAGQPCEYQKIRSLAKKHKLLIIADACHALGASYQGEKIGGFADLTVFSFHPVKSITTGEGGAVLTNHKNFYDQLLLLRSHGVEKDQNGFNVMTKLGFNYRLTDIQTALGLSQLKKLDRFIAKRRQVVGWYRKYLNDCQEIVLPAEFPDSRSAWHIFVIRVKNVKDRLPLYNFLKQNGVGVNFHYPTVYSQPYYQKLDFKIKNCPKADHYSQTAMTLPLYPNLKQTKVKYIVNVIKQYYRV